MSWAKLFRYGTRAGTYGELLRWLHCVSVRPPHGIGGYQIETCVIVSCHKPKMATGTATGSANMKTCRKHKCRWKYDDVREHHLFIPFYCLNHLSSSVLLRLNVVCCWLAALVLDNTVAWSWDVGMFSFLKRRSPCDRNGFSSARSIW